MANSTAVEGRPAGAVRSDVQSCRDDFPVLHQNMGDGRPLVYLDSAATSLKPETVTRAVRDYLTIYSANVHRGLHALSERATEAYEGAREKVARYLGVEDSAQVIFTRGTTEAINLAAQSWGRANLRSGDEIILNDLEHHSNFVPWQMAARERGATLRFAELTADARLTVDAVAAVMNDRTRLIAVTGMSNVTGSVPPVAEIIELAHSRGVLVLIDAAQSLPHQRFNAVELDADFVAFSGHKLCGPTGVGALYAKRELLEAMPPVLTGGSMVTRVTRERAEWNEVPWKFEAGTPPIAEAIGLGAAIDYLSRFSPADLAAHEHALVRRAHEVMGRIKGLRILGPADPARKGAIVGFTLEGTHPHDLAQLLDRHGIAIRAGHHCAMPLHTRLGVPASARASFYLYNTIDEVDRLAEALESVKTLLQRRAHPHPAPNPPSPPATEHPNG